jgi:hypothetical protein
MPRLWDVPKDIRTVHLCSCAPHHAVEIGEALDAAGIVWWEKPPTAGLLAFLEREVQIFVDRDHVDDARAVARQVLEDGSA